MRTLRRFFRRLTSWATKQRDEERLRAEIEEHLALQTADNFRAGLSPVEARRQAALQFGGVETIKESYRDQKGTAAPGKPGSGHALRAAALANGPGVQHRHGFDAGAGHRRHHLDFHPGERRSAEIAAGGQARGVVPPGKGNPVLLHDRIQPGERVLAGLVRFVQIFERPYQGLFGTGGRSVHSVAVWDAACGQCGGSP